MDDNNMNAPKKNDWMLPASILIAAVLISGSIIYLVKSNKGNAGGALVEQTGQTGGAGAVQEDVAKLGSRDVILGDPNAPVTVIEYADFQCPYCGRFFETTEKQIRENYIKSGKVKMVYRDFPFIDQFTDDAKKKNESHLSAEAAECAKDQGKFWAFHDALYNSEITDSHENNGNLNRALFVTLAKNVGLDVDGFSSCYDSHKYAEAVSKSVNDAQAIGVNSTPTTFVNGKNIVDARGNSVGADTASIIKAIDSALNAK